MLALTPLAKEQLNFIASSAHHTGASMDTQRDRSEAAREMHASVSDKDVPDSIKWQRASFVTHNEVHFSVSGVISNQAVYPEAPPKPTFNAQTIADNVLAFIDIRLNQMVEEGASNDEIQEMLDQAEKGVAQGIGEAIDILKGMAAMTDEIKGGIEQAQGLLTDGITQRREPFLEEVVVPNEDAPEIALVEAAKPETNAAQSQQPNESSETLSSGNNIKQPSLSHFVPNLTSPLNTDTSYGRYEFHALERSFDMQIRTQDGDVVTLAMGYQQSFESRFGMVTQNMGGSQASATSYDAYYSESSQLMFSVNGELDEDELAAIDHLMMQVNKLADEFYSGDVEKAFQSAMKLNFDASELSSFALNLKHSEMHQVAETYKQVEYMPGRKSISDPSESVKATFQEILSPMAQYVNKLLQQLETMQESLQERNPKMKAEALTQALLQHPKHLNDAYPEEREKFIRGLEDLVSSRLQG